MLANGVTVGALVAVNSLGSVTIRRSRHFWAAPFEIGDEFGGLGYPHPFPADATEVLLKFRDKDVGANTTIGIVATDAKLTKSEAKRMAIAAQDGFARAIWPTHTPADGDLIFAVSTRRTGKALHGDEAIDHCAVAGATMARAIARAIYNATPDIDDLLPVWSSRV